MTVRDNFADTSPGPEHRVLFIEELRECLGISVDALGTIDTPAQVDESQHPKVYLVGHDMHEDFDNMKKQGIELKERLSYSGCIDTHAMVEDADNGMPKGLSALMAHYGFAKLHRSKPTHNEGKWVFIGAHNVGNGAVATIMVAIAQALDKHVSATRMCDSEADEDLDEGWFNKPLQGIDKSVMLLAYDTEKVESRNKPHILNRITEHRFAWLRLADMAHIPPGDRYGTNWHTEIRAAHFINRQWKDYENKKVLCGNSKGFWPHYGKSQFYDPKDGPAPFHALFERLAGGQNIQNIIAPLRTLSREKPGPDPFPVLATTARSAGKSHHEPPRFDPSSNGRNLNIGEPSASSGFRGRWNSRD